MTTGAASACPNCGAPLRFGGVHSLAAVCSYCKSAVARHGVELALVGKVPDLVATDTRLALGITGHAGGRTFVILGHLQLARAGKDGVTDATWDEWYASFADGNWGWLAEAQGRLYLTEPLAGRAPSARFDALRAGQRIDEPGVGVLAVEEVGESRFVAAEGELPFSPAIGASYRFADLSAADGRFFTFDYGAANDEPAIFAGRRLEYDEAGLTDHAPPPHLGATEGEALTCPHCGASLSLKNSDSVSITCPSCRSLLERSDGGVALLFELASREEPAIPLGSKGEIAGEPAEVLGWMRRSTDADGVRYFWDEYLLHGESGYRWLTESDGQWHLVAPIDAGRVTPMGRRARCGERTFRHFQSAQAVYEQVQGEFYWRVLYDQRVEVADWVDPPYILSSENDGREENWSLGQWVSAEHVWKAFGLPGPPPPPSATVGAAQPNAWMRASRRAWAATGVSIAALFVLSGVAGGALPHERVLAVDIPIGGVAGAAESQVFVSDPFELTGARQAVDITAHADCEQSWIGLDTALINDESGESDAVGIDLSYYHGYSDGESWSEGSSSGSEVIGGVRRGRYVLRVEPQFGKDAGGRLPDTVHVEVVRGTFLWAPPLLVFFILLVWPIYAFVRGFGFEKRRWENSDHPIVQSE